MEPATGDPSRSGPGPTGPGPNGPNPRGQLPGRRVSQRRGWWAAGGGAPSGSGGLGRKCPRAGSVAMPPCSRRAGRGRAGCERTGEPRPSGGDPVAGRRDGAGPPPPRGCARSGGVVGCGERGRLFVRRLGPGRLTRPAASPPAASPVPVRGPRAKCLTPARPRPAARSAPRARPRALRPVTRSFPADPSGDPAWTLPPVRIILRDCGAGRAPSQGAQGMRASLDARHPP